MSVTLEKADDDYDDDDDDVRLCCGGSGEVQEKFLVPRPRAVGLAESGKSVRQLKEEEKGFGFLW